MPVVRDGKVGVEAAAYQFFAADHPSLPRTLRGRLEILQSKKLAELYFSQDWADFQKRRGVMDGLSLAITECAEAEKNGD